MLRKIASPERFAISRQAHPQKDYFMPSLTVKSLGVAAISLQAEDGPSLLIDAFNNVNVPPPVRAGDILLFTHADADHFFVDALPDLKPSGTRLFGPPTIVQPVLASGKALPGQLTIAYPEQRSIVHTVDAGGAHISFLQTEHFIDWHPVHVSFLIEMAGKKIFVTGDSQIEMDQQHIDKIDCIIANLVDKGFITRSDDPRFAVHHHLSYLLRVISRFAPRKIIASHLIGFANTVAPQDFKSLVEAYGFGDRIAVPSDTAPITL